MRRKFIPTLKETVSDAQRLREIVRVLFAVGFEQYIAAARLRSLIPLPHRLRRELMPPLEPTDPIAVRLRRACEELGPTFVKFGQMLSVRPDVVGEEAAREFAALQEHVAPIPHAEVVAAVEEALGGSWRRAFRSISQRPLASASVSQVHRAVTADGRKIVLKVQRPGSREEITRDLHLLALLARLLERYVPASRNLQPVEMVRTFSEWTIREFDFTVEAGHIERFRADFADEPRMHVPSVHWEYTRPTLLAMDEIAGIRIGDAKRLRAAKIKRREVAQFVLRAFLRQFFGTGFFHGDPHPGNLLVTRPSTSSGQAGILLYDFGIMGYLPAEVRQELVAAMRAYLRRDVEAFVKHVLDMSEIPSDADVPGFSREVRATVDALMYRPTARKGVPDAFYRIVVAGGRYGVRFPTDLVLFAKALLTVQGVLVRLDPRIELDASLAPLFSELAAAQFDPRRWLPEAQEQALEFVRRLSRLPERTVALLDRIEKGRLSVRLDLEEMKTLLQEFDRENDLRVLAVVATGIFVASALLLTAPGALPWGGALGKMGLVAAAAMLLGVFLEARKKPA